MKVIYEQQTFGNPFKSYTQTMVIKLSSSCVAIQSKAGQFNTFQDLNWFKGYSIHVWLSNSMAIKSIQIPSRVIKPSFSRDIKNKGNRIHSRPWNKFHYPWDDLVETVWDPGSSNHFKVHQILSRQSRVIKSFQGSANPFKGHQFIQRQSNPGGIHLLWPKGHLNASYLYVFRQVCCEIVGRWRMIMYIRILYLAPLECLLSFAPFSNTFSARFVGG